ncbi:alpha/beta-hydrolase [Glonium stellatum]|uniref:Alpha/beta-hydrolase n=1 Tax=Glonium stellatum TaxID=574774 RepID=A0A8E2F427_9PEZI|nr:alpha/beta-hydrolase [Glonium stellatum]
MADGVPDCTKLSRPLDVTPLETDKKPICNVKSLSISVEDGPGGVVPGLLHLPATFSSAPSPPSLNRQTAAVILLSGAGGGVVGPSSIYLSMANKLASLSMPVPALRLDYRFPARNKYCVRDVQAAMDLLETEYGLSRFVLIGWSFGSAPVFTVAGIDQRVIGCGTVASQTAETEGLKLLAPRPVLLLHGTGDRTLSYRCSERLFDMYSLNGDRQLKLFEGDDHALSKNSEEAEKMLCEFVLKCAAVGVVAEDRGILEEKLLTEEEKIDLMKKGGDLRGEESIE